MIHRLLAATCLLTLLVAPLVAGFAAAVATLLVVMAASGALDDLYKATIAYNLFYSGETYRGIGFLQYLLTFPVSHARVDALWFLGGLGAACLVLAAWRAPQRLIAPIWMGIAACVVATVFAAVLIPQRAPAAPMPAASLTTASGASEPVHPRP